MYCFPGSWLYSYLNLRNAASVYKAGLQWMSRVSSYLHTFSITFRLWTQKVNTCTVCQGENGRPAPIGDALATSISMACVIMPQALRLTDQLIGSGTVLFLAGWGERIQRQVSCSNFRTFNASLPNQIVTKLTGQYLGYSASMVSSLNCWQISCFHYMISRGLLVFLVDAAVHIVFD